MVLDRAPVSEPVAQFKFSARIFVTEFSPYEWSANLIALGLAESVVIGQIKVPEEEENCQKPEFERLRDIHHDSRVQCLSWGPRTSQLVAPRCLQFATSGTDHKLRIFSTDSSQVNVKMLKGHTDYINGIAFEPEVGELVTSCSDDHTARLWDTNSGTSLHTFHLSSPGMTVCWHPSETGKLLVAEKSGVISIFNSSNYTPILSLDSCCSPLLDADWSRSNSTLVAAAVLADVVYFDLSRPSLPLDRRTVHRDGTRQVRFARSADSLVATVGKPGATLKVSQQKSGLVVVSNEKRIIGGGCSWHLRLPYLAVGNDREIDLYKLSL